MNTSRIMIKLVVNRKKFWLIVILQPHSVTYLFLDFVGWIVECNLRVILLQTPKFFLAYILYYT